MAKRAKNIEVKKRTYWCHVRLTEDEYNILQNKLKTTTCRKVSDYVRNVLFEKPITVRQRNQSLDEFMNVLIRLRSDLNALGNNFNQVVRKLNSFKDSDKIIIWIPIAEGLQRELIGEIKKIQQKINEFSNRWLQK